MSETEDKPNISVTKIGTISQAVLLYSNMQMSVVKGASSNFKQDSLSTTMIVVHVKEKTGHR